MFGKIHTEETKAKLKAFGLIRNQGKAVLVHDMETGEIINFVSKNAAATELKTSITTINNYIKSQKICFRAPGRALEKFRISLKT